MQKHQLVDGTLKRDEGGITARCVCGWTSSHWSSLSASAAFRDHQEECAARSKPETGE